MLIWALGAVPSKDTFWTTNQNDIAVALGGCPAGGHVPYFVTFDANQNDIAIALGGCPAGGHVPYLRCYRYI
jgi:hypothetical protein